MDRRACNLVIALGLAMVWTADVCAADGDAPGLVMTAQDAMHRVVLVTATPNFILQPNQSVHPSLSADFSATWSGLLTITRAGQYTIGHTADRARVFVDDRDVTGVAIELGPGRHPIRILYIRAGGGEAAGKPAQLRLLWQSEHFPAEPLPSSLLSHDPTKLLLDQPRLIERGRDLVEALGCVNCHAARSTSLLGRKGPDLTNIGSRTHRGWLDKWLADPTQFRAGAVMPAMLNDQQRRDVTAYLSSLQSEVPPAQVDAPTQHDLTMGKRLYDSLGCAACHEQDDLLLAGLGSKTDARSLSAYLKDPAAIDPDGPMPSLSLSDEEAFQLAAHLLQSTNAAFEQRVGPGDAAQGKAVVQSAGCLACHKLTDSQPLADALSAPVLHELEDDQGCLADPPGAAMPRYTFSDNDRSAIRAFLESSKHHPDVSEAPTFQFARMVRQLRCTACHPLDQLGPTVALVEAAPQLTDIGAKLRSSALRRVLLEHERVRPWMRLRMPNYSSQQAEPFVHMFARAAGVPPGEGPPSPPTTDAQREMGVHLIGSNAQKGGLGCISCHDWLDHKALGEKAPQLADAASRVRVDWFKRWLHTPGRIVAGTAMPVFFGNLTRREADERIAELWAALAMGRDMPQPDGVGLTPFVLGSEDAPVPLHEALVLRTYMPEATPAAIAVGMPASALNDPVSVCFDATECRIRYAWRGGFIDLRPTMSKGMQPPNLLGDIFYRCQQMPLRVGNVDRIPNHRFRGYRMVGGYPEFRYEIDGIDVRQRVVPAAEQTGLTQQFRIADVSRPMWLVIDNNQGVTMTSTVGEFQDGVLKLPQGRNVRFDVTIIAQEEY